MAHCSESILEAITGGTNSSPQLQPGQSGKRLCQRTTTSSSSMTCCHLMSEPLALTPVAHSATRVKASSSRVSGHKDVRMLVLLIYAKIQHIMECMLLFQVWLRSAGCRPDGAAGCTLHHCCAAEEVHTRSHTPSYQVKKPFCQFSRLHTCCCSIFFFSLRDIWLKFCSQGFPFWIFTCFNKTPPPQESIIFHLIFIYTLTAYRVSIYSLLHATKKFGYSLRCNDVLLVRILSPGGMVSVNVQSEACQGRTDEINTLEHVQVRKQPGGMNMQNI